MMNNWKKGTKTIKGFVARNNESAPGSGVYIVERNGNMYAFADNFPSPANVSVRWAFGNSPDGWPSTLDEVAADELAQLEGLSKADYYDRYSELTGYLWTEENCKVGGHDLMRVMHQNVGKWVWMEIQYEYP